MNETRRQRPGPIGFHAEAKATHQRRGPSQNESGISEAKLTRETRSKSTELKIVSLSWWTTAGILTLILGVALLSPFIAVIGVFIIVAVIATRVRNQTESRLRTEFEMQENMR